MSREAMQIALDALEANLGNWAAKTKAVEVLRQTLEHEPVAWASSLDFDDDDQEIIAAKDKGKLGTNNCDIPLYTAPKQWVELTDEEIQDLSYLSQKIDEGNAAWFDRLGFAKAIEQALKEKNT